MNDGAIPTVFEVYFLNTHVLIYIYPRGQVCIIMIWSRPPNASQRLMSSDLCTPTTFLPQHEELIFTANLKLNTAVPPYLLIHSGTCDEC